MNFKKLIACIMLCLFFNNNCYEPGPLPANWSLTFKAGVAPTLLTDRGAIAPVVCSSTPPVFTAACEQKFSDLWGNHPLTVGVDLAYAVADYMEFFGEVDYRRTKAHTSCFTATQLGEEFGVITLHLDSFRAVGAYVGLRYFSCRYIYERMSFFVGSKLGLMHYQKVNACPLTFESPENNSIFDQNNLWFEASTVVSGGLQVGFDCLLTCRWSLFFNAEVVAGAAPKTAFNIIKQDELVLPDFTNIIHEQSGTLLAFPINLGLRFYF